MKENGKIVYLSGDQNHKKEFSAAELFLVQMGYIVINPSRIDEISKDLGDEHYMRVCYSLVDVADVIFMVSGWQKAKGATAELSYAKSLGKEVKYQDYYSPWRKGQLIVIPNVGDESIIDDAPFRKVAEE